MVDKLQSEDVIKCFKFIGWDVQFFVDGYDQVVILKVVNKVKKVIFGKFQLIVVKIVIGKGIFEV